MFDLFTLNFFNWPFQAPCCNFPAMMGDKIIVLPIKFYSDLNILGKASIEQLAF